MQITFGASARKKLSAAVLALSGIATGGYYAHQSGYESGQSDMQAGVDAFCPGAKSCEVHTHAKMDVVYSEWAFKLLRDTVELENASNHNNKAMARILLKEGKHYKNVAGIFYEPGRDIYMGGLVYKGEASGNGTLKILSPELKDGVAYLKPDGSLVVKRRGETDPAKVENLVRRIYKESNKPQGMTDIELADRDCEWPTFNNSYLLGRCR